MKMHIGVKVSIPVLLLIFAISLFSVQSETLTAGELYASGISGGKIKPLIDIDNKLFVPAKSKTKKKFSSVRDKRPNIDTTKVIEDASKYYLIIEPIYPKQARLAIKEAIVELVLKFGKDGRMQDALITKCNTPGWGFEQATLAASLESTLSGHGKREITVRTKVKFVLQ